MSSIIFSKTMRDKIAFGTYKASIRHFDLDRIAKRNVGITNRRKPNPEGGTMSGGRSAKNPSFQRDREALKKYIKP
jgi:hypothetical protein